MSVYFIKPVGMDGPIKIGCSESPERRRRALATWSPFELEIIAEIEGDFDLERRFHAFLQPWHERREWFAGSPEVWAVIKAVQAGSFDTANLPAPICVTTNRKSASAAHRASWTPERRLQASYDGRIRWTQKRTGTVCPGFASMIHNPAVRARIDAYLLDPHAHGETIEAYEARVGCKPFWARHLTKPAAA